MHGCMKTRRYFHSTWSLTYILMTIPASMSNIIWKALSERSSKKSSLLIFIQPAHIQSVKMVAIANCSITTPSIPGISCYLHTSYLMISGVLTVALAFLCLFRLAWSVVSIVKTRMQTHMSQYLSTASDGLERQILIYIFLGWSIHLVHLCVQAATVLFTGYCNIPSFLASVSLFLANTVYIYTLYYRGLNRHVSSEYLCGCLRHHHVGETR